MPRKPRLGKGPASYYASPNEIIREFTNGQQGGLISLRTLENGDLVAELYRLDGEVVVHVPTKNRAATRVTPSDAFEGAETYATGRMRSLWDGVDELPRDVVDDALKAAYIAGAMLVIEGLSAQDAVTRFSPPPA